MECNKSENVNFSVNGHMKKMCDNSSTNRILILGSFRLDYE